MGILPVNISLTPMNVPSDGSWRTAQKRSDAMKKTYEGQALRESRDGP